MVHGAHVGQGHELEDGVRVRWRGSRRCGARRVGRSARANCGPRATWGAAARREHELGRHFGIVDLRIIALITMRKTLQK